ncbi:MAG: type II toxin-antitoxin system VapC family toxin [Pyrinomonadaceae bacterium]|nr:type II toxin-antitoxin system VapC family toxin [Pyrinomonadaceae bacterium]
MIILDTDCLSLLERKGSAESYRLSAKLSEFSPEEIAVTIITFEEQMRGWMAFIAKANSIEKQISAYRKLEKFLETYKFIPIVQFDEKDGEIFQDLKSRKIKVGTMDLKIASIAISHNALLISRNLSDYDRIPNLRVQDWTRESYTN